MIPGITALIGFLVALVIFSLVRRDQMQISKAFVWLLVAAGFGLLGFAPAAFDRLATLTGISYPPALAFTIALVLVAVKLLLNDLEISRLNARQIRLVQKLAIMQANREEFNAPTSANPARGLADTDNP